MKACHIRQAVFNIINMSKPYQEGSHYLDDTKKEVISYTVERKFLALISVKEFVNRIIQSHINSESIKRFPLNEKDIGKITYL